MSTPTPEVSHKRTTVVRWWFVLLWTGVSPRTGFRVMKTVTDEAGATRPADIFTREGGLPAEARVLNPW
jgi:hypothetical protein